MNLDQTQTQKKFQRPNELMRKVLFALFLGLFAINLFLGGILTAFVFLDRIDISLPGLTSIFTPLFPSTTEDTPFEFVQFRSATEFQQYLEENANNAAFYGRGLTALSPAIEMEWATEMSDTLAPGTNLREKSIPQTATPDRVSQTNVQVIGIDEPDLVKTDGQNIYYSTESVPIFIEPAGVLDMMIAPPPQYQATTKVISAFPPADMELLTNIDHSGDLLLIQDTLVIFTSDTIYGFDVSNPDDPEQIWDLMLEDDHQFVEARLYDDQIYILTQDRIYSEIPCPFQPITEFRAIECTEIYHPTYNIPIDVIFTAMIIDPFQGEVKQSISFVGASGSSVIYMSEEAIYVTYVYYAKLSTILIESITSLNSDLIPPTVKQQLRQLLDYDLGEQAKLVEVQTIIEQYQTALDNDTALQFENELENQLQDYYQANLRNLEQTGIVKLPLDNLDRIQSGSVPGIPLNQFALDEYDQHLRIATTVGENGFATSESENDIYVLNQNLKRVGSVQGMGVGERIYSVRFIQEQGYLVTFRETDPFYVVDLANPQAPKIKGELKIPGYSAYLHPLDDKTILGIGKEQNQVKLSLFDVSDPDNPIELDKYLLKEYWTDILDTHHAFLLDPKHQVFFLPGSQGGYVFSYQSAQLDLVRTIRMAAAQRALYLDDFLYIIGESEITVIDETTWEELNQLRL